MRYADSLKHSKIHEILNHLEFNSKYQSLLYHGSILHLLMADNLKLEDVLCGPFSLNKTN